MERDEMRTARRRGRAMLEHLPRATGACYDIRLRRLLVTLTTGLDVAIPPALVEMLQGASDEQLQSVQVTAPGFELYFPALDDGVWLPALLEGTFGTQRWMRDRHYAEVDVAA